jgi:hypothetical protein
MRGALAREPLAEFGWLVAPVLNHHTCLAAELEARSGRMRLQSWSRGVPATRVLRLGEP